MDLIGIDEHLKNKGSISELRIDEIKELANMLPSAGVIDTAVAEELATAFLYGSSVVADLLEVIVKYEGRAIARKKSAWAIAMYDRAKKADLKTAKDRESFADADGEYIEENAYCVDLTAFRKWLEQKHEFFIRSHYLAKTVWESGRRQEPLGPAPVTSVGEEDWV